MSNEVVLYDKKNTGVALITLNRPDRLNAITGELTARLKEKIDDACKDDDVKVIVLTGAGRGFSAGADMDGLSTISDSGSMDGDESKDKPEQREYAKDRMEYFREFHRVIAPVVVLKKDE